jgi:uncharacterized membrane protein YfcA
VTTIFFSLLVNFLRGSKKSPSLLGAQKCGALDWSIFVIFVIIALILSFIGVSINKKEQALKERCGHKILDCEIKYNGKQLFYLLFFAFWGGFISGALGLGGGSIFNPLMISMGVPPAVSTSTGMYMIMLSTLASSIIYISYDQLNIPYAVWLGFWTSLGILFGLRVIKALIQKYDRPSIIVFVLAGVMGASALMVPIFTGIEQAQLAEEGKNIWEF